MVDALENFFNWLSDMDWFWGPLLYLRPLKNARMTLRFWLKMIGVVVLFVAPIEAIFGSLFVYYNYTTAKHHEPKIPPVAATQNWIGRCSPQLVLSNCALIIALCIFLCACQHWAWNRRADRLSQGAVSSQPVFAGMPGVWPPPPSVL